MCVCMFIHLYKYIGLALLFSMSQALISFVGGEGRPGMLAWPAAVLFPSLYRLDTPPLPLD